MHEVLVNHLGGLRLPRKSVVRLTDRLDMTLDVYRGRKTTMQQQQHITSVRVVFCVQMHSFEGLIRRTPLPKFSDTAVTDHHSYTTFSSSEHTGCGYPAIVD